MKKYQVFCKPCEDHPEGSLCCDPREYEWHSEGDDEGYAIFDTKEQAQELIQYLCDEWLIAQGVVTYDAYEVVEKTAPEVRYGIWYKGSEGCSAGFWDADVKYIFKTPEEAVAYVNTSLQGYFPDWKENYTIVTITFPEGLE